MLYFVATPIGNLKDVTYRAIETLQSVDVIACEDTRHSLVFLNHYSIKKQLISYHKFNENASADKIIAFLNEGKSVAVISDAGTPAISDPGCVLVKKLIENQLDFTVIPGANAFVPALIMSGMDTQNFAFIGFLPEKSREAKELLKSFEGLTCPLVFYCAPHDVEKTVKRLYECLGERKACAVREITKLHEQRIEFNLSEGYSGELRGEFVIIVEGAKEKGQENCRLSIQKHVELLMLSGISKMDAIKQVARERKIAKNDVYKEVVDLKQDQ